MDQQHRDTRDRFLKKISSKIPNYIPDDHRDSFVTGYEQGHNILWLHLISARAIDFETLKTYVDKSEKL